LISLSEKEIVIQNITEENITINIQNKIYQHSYDFPKKKKWYLYSYIYYIHNLIKQKKQN
jgi:hypothetical protein